MVRGLDLILVNERYYCLHIGDIGLLVMFITYIPVLGFYQRSWLWALLMPLVAGMFLGMTWTSAIRYWRGERMRWRGRTSFANNLPKGRQTGKHQATSSKLSLLLFKYLFGFILSS